MSFELILVRHGESQWNLENKFTGWADVPLTENGTEEASLAANDLQQSGYKFDCLYTSVLKRAIHTAHILIDQMDLSWIPEVKAWQLNERAYGALQGLDKAETAKKYGDDQVKVWRRSYDTPPPALALDDPRYPGNDEKYKNLSSDQVPLSESLKDTVARVVPYYEQEILPKILKGQRVLVVAHGNSIRALIKHLEGMSESEILEFNVPTAVPILLKLDQQGKFVKRDFIGDAKRIAEKIDKVANQAKSK